jgi:hypothetical protein
MEADERATGERERGTFDFPIYRYVPILPRPPGTIMIAGGCGLAILPAAILDRIALDFPQVA